MKDDYDKLSKEWGSKRRKADSRAGKKALRKPTLSDLEEWYDEVVASTAAYSKAVQAYEEARDIYRQFSSKNRPPEVLAMYNRAKAHLENERKK